MGLYIRLVCSAPDDMDRNLICIKFLMSLRGGGIFKLMVQSDHQVVQNLGRGILNFNLCNTLHLTWATYICLLRFLMIFEVMGKLVQKMSSW